MTPRKTCSAQNSGTARLGVPTWGILLLGLLPSCSGDDPTLAPKWGPGGSGATASGGVASGGTATSAGMSAGAGLPGSGGASGTPASSGGAPAAQGGSAQAGTAQGGSPQAGSAQGGSPQAGSAQGGNSGAAGSLMSKGGSSSGGAAGGAPAGGASGKSGTSKGGNAGSPGAGGTTGTGGTATGKGGSTGGATATGGKSATGGAGGASSDGCSKYQTGATGKEPGGQIPVCCAPSSAEKPSIDEVFRLLNEHRAANGLSALAYDTELEATIQGHCAHMSQHTFFAHEAPETGVVSPWDRAKSCGTTANGENIAQGQRTAAAVMTAWKNSSGHNANMLGKFMRVGIGFEDTGYYWGQIFGQ